MTAAERPGWALSFAYDALNRLTGETGPLGTIESDYRIDGVRERITYPDGQYFDTSYWDNGAPLALYEGDNSGDRLGLWTYDTRQRLTRYYAGEAPGRSIQYFDYDPVSRLSEIEHNIPIVADRVTIGLSGYNPAGQIVTRTRSNAAYAFDAPQTGTTGYTVNGLNQYSTVNPPGSETTSETYDARGNLTEYDSSIAADDRDYSYDALNRLESARLGGASSPLSRFFYDPLGRLSAVTTGGAGGRRYLWDGDRIIAQYAGGALTVQRRFVHAPGSLGAPVTEYVGAAVDLASRRYLQTDERGSVISVVHADNGATAEINTYGPYGENGADNGGQFQYAGQLWLPEAGLYYMRNRAYDPALGRFVQTDPIGYAGGMNLYAYGGNDAINFVDPFGLAEIEVVSCTPVTGTRIGCHGEGHQHPGVSHDLFPAVGGGGAGGFIILPGVAGPSSTLPDGTIVVTAPIIRYYFFGGFGGFNIADPGTWGPSPRDFFEGPIERALRGVQGAIQSAICAIPPLGVSVGMDRFFGGGAGGSVGASFDLGSGEISTFETYYGGVGLDRGPYASLVFNAPSGNTRNSFDQGSAALGLGGALSRNFEGTNEGEWTASITLASPGANASSGFQSSETLVGPLYDLGCDG